MKDLINPIEYWEYITVPASMLPEGYNGEIKTYHDVMKRQIELWDIDQYKVIFTTIFGLYISNSLYVWGMTDKTIKDIILDKKAIGRRMKMLTNKSKEFNKYAYEKKIVFYSSADLDFIKDLAETPKSITGFNSIIFDRIDNNILKEFDIKNETLYWIGQLYSQIERLSKEIQLSLIDKNAAKKIINHKDLDINYNCCLLYIPSQRLSELMSISGIYQKIILLGHRNFNSSKKSLNPRNKIKEWAFEIWKTERLGQSNKDARKLQALCERINPNNKRGYRTYQKWVVDFCEQNLQTKNHQKN